jgi:methionine-rich copper-binding protein CopC
MRCLVFLVFLATLAVPANQAFAHSKLKSSVPANGASVPGNFKEARLDFLEPIEAELSHFELVDEAGKVVVRAEGATACEPKSCRFAVEVLPPGGYRIGYHILSGDGHVIEGDIHFTVKAAP